MSLADMEMETNSRTESDLDGAQHERLSLEENCVRIFDAIFHGQIRGHPSHHDTSNFLLTMEKAQATSDPDESSLLPFAHSHAVRCFRHFLCILLHSAVEHHANSHHALRSHCITLMKLYTVAGNLSHLLS